MYCVFYCLHICINKKHKIMKMFNASFETVIWRYYLMMVMVFVPFLVGMPILAVLAVPVFLSALLGVSFTSEKKTKEVVKNKILDSNVNSEINYNRAA